MMTPYTCFGRGEPLNGIRDAICEGGAGFLRGHFVAQMAKGGWAATVAAVNGVTKEYPPIDPLAAKAYFAATNPGDVFLSNFNENRFSAYDAKQLNIIFDAAQARGLLVAHYGFPTFDPKTEHDDFWRKIRSRVDIITPAYYADESDPANCPLDGWSDRDYERMTLQLSESRRYAGTTEDIGFVISPQTHQGHDLSPLKMQRQIAFLKASGVKHLFIWSQYAATKPANLAAAKIVAPAATAEGAES